jgi:hypothetical protein
MEFDWLQNILVGKGVTQSKSSSYLKCRNPSYIWKLTKDRQTRKWCQDRWPSMKVFSFHSLWKTCDKGRHLWSWSQRGLKQWKRTMHRWFHRLQRSSNMRIHQMLARYRAGANIGRISIQLWFSNYPWWFLNQSSISGRMTIFLEFQLQQVGHLSLPLDQSF